MSSKINEKNDYKRNGKSRSSSNSFAGNSRTINAFQRSWNSHFRLNINQHVGSNAFFNLRTFPAFEIRLLGFMQSSIDHSPTKRNILKELHRTKSWRRQKNRIKTLKMSTLISENGRKIDVKRKRFHNCLN